MSYPPEKAGMPGTTSLPRRQTSVVSDEAVPDQDPGDTSNLLLERLQAWKHACGYLENYISATEKVQKSHAKEYEKVLKTVSDPLKEGHHFDQTLGGIAGLFENIRSNTQGIANAHLETEKNLKGSVLPILGRLHSEIKNKTKELSGGAVKGSKSVDKARNVTQKHIELLGQHTASFDSTGGRVEPANDPYVLQRGIQYRLNKQILEENNNRHDLLAVQNSFQQFEAHVIQTIQTAMSTFLQIVGAQADSTKHMYGDMVNKSSSIPLDFEWRGFVQRNNNLLIDPSAPPRSTENVTFPNQKHRATQALIQGSLERKGKLLKTYSSGYYVVTPAKYLHEFKDDDNFRKDPTPELSLYLPDCVIGGVNGNLFNVKGKDSSKGKVGGALSMTHELAFKAHTPADAEKWWSVVRGAAGQGPANPANFSESGSPVERRNTMEQQPPAYGDKHPAPINTQGSGVTGGQTYASPQSSTAGNTAYNTPASAAPRSAGPTSVGGLGGSPTAMRSAGGLGGSPTAMRGEGVASRDAAYGGKAPGSGVDRAPGQY
ncbi:MAG: hypothetical protein M1827_007689 [Pycnora praestabilis]|nr:MAG: hypothetical protein M1827_007689 [Pycnora praestabilis]